MEFEVKIAEPLSFAGGKPEHNISRHHPFKLISDSEAEFGISIKKTEIPFDASIESGVGIFTMHRHDGTLMYTQAAISAVTNVAESHIAKSPGEWEIGEVIVSSWIEHGDMPYGKNVMHLREAAIVFLRQKM